MDPDIKGQLSASGIRAPTATDGLMLDWRKASSRE
jgi:hypothetical protein